MQRCKAGPDPKILISVSHILNKYTGSKYMAVFSFLGDETRSFLSYIDRIQIDR